MTKLKMISLLLLQGLLLSSAFIPAKAADLRDYLGYGSPYRTETGRFFYQHPYIQKAVLVGGAGAAVGALAGGDGGRLQGATKGAMIGTGLGLGYEFLRERSNYSQGYPYRRY